MNLGFLISAVLSFCVAFGNIKNALYRRDPSVDDVLPGSSTVILLSFTGVDLWVCAYRCDRDLVCEGFLYKTEQQQCSLMRCSLQGLDKDPTPGWLYYSYTNGEIGLCHFMLFYIRVKACFICWNICFFYFALCPQVCARVDTSLTFR